MNFTGKTNRVTPLRVVNTILFLASNFRGKEISISRYILNTTPRSPANKWIPE